VSESATRRTRVLLANLDPIVRLGLSRVLAEDQIDVLGDECDLAGIVLTARQARPDAIVVGGVDPALVEGLRAAAPDAKLIFFEQDEGQTGGEAGRVVVGPSAMARPRARAPISQLVLAARRPPADSGRPHPDSSRPHSEE
jgi:hypothetical protein